MNDNTVPYPSAAIDSSDPFVEWAERGLQVESIDTLITTWSFPTPDSPVRKRNFAWRVGTLPPILRFRKPYSWVSCFVPLTQLIIALFPILIPLIFLLVVARFSLDTHRSRLRLQRLAKSPAAETPPSESPLFPIPSALGLSIDDLRAAIRAVERNLEQDLMDAADKVRFGEQSHLEPKESTSHAACTHVRPLLTAHQLRMVFWLNKLDFERHLVWFPDVANSHAVVIVRWVWLRC